MKIVSMSGSLRESVGKKDAKANRRDGKIPCVLYGGTDQLHFTVEEVSFKEVIFTPEICFIKLNIGGKEYDSILQDVQYHPVTDRILHADFLELVAGKEIVMGVPVYTKGVSPGVLQGGKLIQKLRKVSVKALPENMPEEIMIDISKMEIGSSVKVNDLKLENVSFIDNPSSVVIGVRVTRVVEDTSVKGAGGEESGEGGEKQEGAEKAEEKESGDKE